MGAAVADLEAGHVDNLVRGGFLGDDGNQVLETPAFLQRVVNEMVTNATARVPAIHRNAEDGDNTSLSE